MVDTVKKMTVLKFIAFLQDKHAYSYTAVWR